MGPLMSVTQLKESQSYAAFPLFRRGGGWGATIAKFLTPCRSPQRFFFMRNLLFNRLLNRLFNILLVLDNVISRLRSIWILNDWLSYATFYLMGVYDKQSVTWIRGLTLIVISFRQVVMKLITPTKSLFRNFLFLDSTILVV